MITANGPLEYGKWGGVCGNGRYLSYLTTLDIRAWILVD